MKPDMEMTFGEHLVELRRRVIYALLGLVVCTGACAFFHTQLFNFLASPYERASRQLADDLEAKYAAPGPDGKPVPLPDDVKTQIDKFRHPHIIPGGPTAVFTTIVAICLIGGAFIASPWILYQIWSFVAVGLHSHERRFVYTYGPFSFFLFVAGASFSFVAINLALQALMGIGMGYRVIDNAYTLDGYVTFLAWMTLAFGVAFQTPLVVLFLSKTGIVPFSSLARNQKVVIFIMVILAAILTPGTDLVSMASLGIPLIVLYEFGLVLAWISERRRRRREKEEEKEEAQNGTTDTDSSLDDNPEERIH